jgi:hypothetical protein
MKGYELYSWRVEGQNEWYHVLMTGTDCLKTYEEILSTENAVTDSNLIKLPVKGTEELKAALSHLPEGENVTWISEGWLERVGAPGGNPTARPRGAQRDRQPLPSPGYTTPCTRPADHRPCSSCQGIEEPDRVRSPEETDTTQDGKG